MQIAWVVLCLYLLVGVYLVSKGPLGAWIGKRLEETRFNSDIDAWIAEGVGEHRKSVPDARIRVLGVVFRLLVVLVWPLLLPGVLSQEKPVASAVVESSMPAPVPDKDAVPMQSNLVRRISRLSGTGEVTCLDCGYKERLAATLHFRSRDTSGNVIHLGHQCRSCRKLTTVVMRDGLLPDLHCECGGDLVRDEVLLCPGCASQNLDYECFLMT